MFVECWLKWRVLIHSVGDVCRRCDVLVGTCCFFIFFMLLSTFWIKHIIEFIGCVCIFGSDLCTEDKIYGNNLLLAFISPYWLCVLSKCQVWGGLRIPVFILGLCDSDLRPPHGLVITTRRGRRSLLYQVFRNNKTTCSFLFLRCHLNLKTNISPVISVFRFT